ncbi:MAG: hypothetical protein A3F12_06915 [Gammaproteobacteria bacterium RIFCSPHIGHO2_12_FULL_38_14]|nr:MAG: hypothetical protein A3F12_06915 [Gammaproteobacteria bacterium RIFCSPHIGHO2_12_FULL_38_14]
MAAPQQSGGQPDNSYAVIWGIAALFVALGGVWYVFQSQIVTVYLTIKLYEARFLSFFSSQYFATVQSGLISALADPAKVTFYQLDHLGRGVGNWLRYPIVVLFIVLAFAVYLGNTARIYRRTYKMRDLAKLEQGNWPQISPITGLDLLKTDIDKGRWSMAMTPMQFCKRHQLLLEVRPERKEGMIRKEWDRVEVVLKKGEANKVFTLQLGQLWQSVRQLPPHIKALFAAFAARINADSKSAEKLLMQLAASSITKLDFTGVDELLTKHEKTKNIQKTIDSHAYIYTVMASMLERAREDGVQASADFLWLKPFDRRLWYTLNTVGRQTPFVEVAGIFAHWIAEKEAGKKIIVPMVDEATKALEIALLEVVYRPDETEVQGQ